MKKTQTYQILQRSRDILLANNLLDKLIFQSRMGFGHNKDVPLIPATQNVLFYFDSMVSSTSGIQKRKLLKGW